MINAVINKDYKISLAYLKDKLKDREYEVLDLHDVSINEVAKLFLSINLLGESPDLIIINSSFLTTKSHKLKKKEMPALEMIFNSKGSNDIYFLVEKELNNSIDYVKENSKNIKVHKVTNDLNINNFIKENDIAISKENLTYIKESIDENYSVEMELLKLSILASEENTNEITKDIIDNFLVFKTEITIFNFIETVLLGNSKKSYQIYKDEVSKLDFKQEEILAIFASQVKFLLQSKILLETNNVNNASSILKTSPYRMKMNMNLINKLSFKRLRNYFTLIARYDYLIKSGKTKEEDVILNLIML